MSNQPVDHTQQRNPESVMRQKLCQSGCGFYGTEQTFGYCSKCYSEMKGADDSVAVVVDTHAEESDAAMFHSFDDDSDNSISSSPCLPCHSPSSTSETPRLRHLPGGGLLDRFVYKNINSSDAVLTATLVADSTSIFPSETAVASMELISAIELSDDDSIKPIQKNLKRCFACNKKHGLLGFTCKCGYVFCDSHRHPTSHDCTFDFKEDGRVLIEAMHRKVAPEKIIRF